MSGVGFEIERQAGSCEKSRLLEDAFFCLKRFTGWNKCLTAAKDVPVIVRVSYLIRVFVFTDCCEPRLSFDSSLEGAGDLRLEGSE